MKKRVLMIFVAVFLAIPLVVSSAQVKDTIRIGCPNDYTPIPPEGDSIAVQLYIYTAAPTSGVGLGFHYDSDFIEFSSWTLGSAVPVGTGLKQQLGFPADNRFTLGWLDFTGQTPIPASTGNGGGLFGTMYFKILAGAAKQFIPIDSTFIPPASFFVFSQQGGALTVTPQFVTCGIGLPVYEYDTPVLPTVFALSQNSPNPFNPSTSIDFDLPRAAKTTIEIYNILGQKVKTLVDEYLSAGKKRVEWDGTDATNTPVASGVYLYKMIANDFTGTKKMLLMK